MGCVAVTLSTLSQILQPGATVLVSAKQARALGLVQGVKMDLVSQGVAPTAKVEKIVVQEIKD